MKVNPQVLTGFKPLRVSDQTLYFSTDKNVAAVLRLRLKL